MIYCVWYPPGGFGHYVNSIITMYGYGFKKPNDTSILIDSKGSSHGTERSAPIYLHDPESYEFEFDSNFHYSVLIDNGNNTSERFRQFFPGATIIKITYDDWYWPIVARTVVEKASHEDFDQFIKGFDWSRCGSIRFQENCVHYIKDHSLRKTFSSDGLEQTLALADVVNYQRLKTRLEQFGIELQDFESKHNEFLEKNAVYIDPVLNSLKLLDDVEHQRWSDLSYFDHNPWAQSIVYFYLWKKYNLTDYSTWFKSCDQLIDTVKNRRIV